MKKAIITLAIIAVIGTGLGFWYQMTFATTSGPNSGSTFTTVANGGTLGWTNTSNAASSNNSYVTSSASSATVKNSYYLQATGFGFSIPAGATINGIKAEVERKAEYDDEWQWATDYLVKLVKGGTIQGNSKADTSTHWPTSDAYKTYGGESDLWGLTLTADDVNSADFGLAFSTSITSDPELGITISVDHMRITVYYTEAASGTSGATTMMMGMAF